MFIRNKVKEVISKYNTNNPFEIIDILDITLVIYPLHNSINGFFQVKDNYPIIYINSNLCYEEKIMTAAHELGHYFLHDGVNALACHNSFGFYIAFMVALFVFLYIINKKLGLGLGFEYKGGVKLWKE